MEHNAVCGMPRGSNPKSWNGNADTQVRFPDLYDAGRKSRTRGSRAGSDADPAFLIPNFLPPSVPAVFSRDRRSGADGN